MGCSKNVCLLHTAIHSTYLAINNGRETEVIKYLCTVAPIHGTYLAINNGRETEVVKYLCTVAPDVDRPILPLALVIEAIDLRMQKQQTQTPKH